MTREELLAVARRAFEAHPQIGRSANDDPLLAFLLERIENYYDPARPVESAKDSLKHVALGVFVMLGALYAL